MILIPLLLALLIAAVVAVVVLAKNGIIPLPDASGKPSPQTPDSSTDDWPEDSLPYRKKDFLLSRAERSFYGVLNSVVQDEWLIFSKVRMLDLVWLPKNTNKSQSYRNRIQSKHVDFLLCSQDTVSPLLVIELDDSSHRSRRAIESDAVKNDVLRAAGLPVLRVPAKASYNTNELISGIRHAMGDSTPASELGAARP